MSSGMNHCDKTTQEMLTMYADGVLPAGQQGALFNHLSSCQDCQRVLEGVLSFRRWSRVEALAIPPNVDDRIFAKLDKIRNRKPNAVVDPSLWDSKMSMTFKTWLFAAMLVFAFGISVQSALAPTADISGEGQVAEVEPIYVFYPGVTVEAGP